MPGDQQSSGKILTVYVMSEAHRAAAQELFTNAFNPDPSRRPLELTQGLSTVRYGGYEAFRIVVEEDPWRPILENHPHCVVYTR